MLITHIEIYRFSIKMEPFVIASADKIESSKNCNQKKLKEDFWVEYLEFFLCSLIRSLRLAHPKGLPAAVYPAVLGLHVLDFFPNSTSVANCCVAPVLALSSTSCTLLRCAPSAPGTSSTEASFERSLMMLIASKIFQQLFAVLC